MANYEKALSELLDVVEHLVGTHVRWNVDMSHGQALAKLVAARTHIIATDVSQTAADVEAGNAEAVVTDGVGLVTDAADMVKHSE